MKKICLLIIAVILSGCGSTIRLDYTGEHGTVGVGVTLPQRQGYAK